MEKNNLKKLLRERWDSWVDESTSHGFPVFDIKF